MEVKYLTSYTWLYRKCLSHYCLHEAMAVTQTTEYFYTSTLIFSSHMTREQGMLSTHEQVFGHSGGTSTQASLCLTITCVVLLICGGLNMNDETDTDKLNDK